MVRSGTLATILHTWRHLEAGLEMGAVRRRFDDFWTAGIELRKTRLKLALLLLEALRLVKGSIVVNERLHCSISELHKQWAKLEDEHHQLARAIDEARTAGTDLAPMRQQQVELLLEITKIVAEIRDAPAMTPEDLVALLDVALEHELDLASDMAFYGPADYPMTARLLCELARSVPGFEFNSLRRWLSASGQFDQLMGRAGSVPRDEGRPVEQIGFGEP